MMSALDKEAALTKGGAAPSAMREPQPWLLGSTELELKPRAAQRWPRKMSLETVVLERPAERRAHRARRKVVMMSALGRLVAATTMMPMARPRATSSRRRATNSSWVFLSLTVLEKYTVSSTATRIAANESPGFIFCPR